MTISAPDSRFDRDPHARRGGAPERETELAAPPAPASIGWPRPSKMYVRSHPAHFIAFGGGIGLVAVAPGTMGTLAAFPLFWVLSYLFDPITFLLIIGAMFLIGVWACSAAGSALGEHDHGGMVWDEITAFLIVLFFTPNNLLWQVFAFLLFRLFDIMKPPPIRYYEKKFRGGFGAMFDDLLAAFLTLLCLAAWKAFEIGRFIS